MVDKMNPTSQFHPYQPQTATPHSGDTGTGNFGNAGGLGGLLGKLGIDQSTIGSLGGNLKNMDVRGGIEKARGAARANPNLVLGGLAALVIGAGLMRKRSKR